MGILALIKTDWRAIILSKTSNKLSYWRSCCQFRTETVSPLQKNATFFFVAPHQQSASRYRSCCKPMTSIRIGKRSPRAGRWSITSWFNKISSTRVCSSWPHERRSQYIPYYTGGQRSTEQFRSILMSTLRNSYYNKPSCIYYRTPSTISKGYYSKGTTQREGFIQRKLLVTLIILNT